MTIPRQASLEEISPRRVVEQIARVFSVEDDLTPDLRAKDFEPCLGDEDTAEDVVALDEGEDACDDLGREGGHV